MRDSVLFYRSFWDAVKGLPPEQLKVAVTAILEYGFDGKTPETEGIGKIVFLLSKSQIDRGIHLLDGQNSRHCKEYKSWRNKVFSRDDYTCQMCRKRGIKLNAHHIKPFCGFPELRFDVKNGITLCVDCHREVHKREK